MDMEDKETWKNQSEIISAWLQEESPAWKKY